jgi:hypothetical protein
MTARRWRFIAFVVCGLAVLATISLWLDADFGCVRDGERVGFMDCQGGRMVGHGLGGRIGEGGLGLLGGVALLGAVTSMACELYVRHRTVRRPTRGGYWSTRP